MCVCTHNVARRGHIASGAGGPGRRPAGRRARAAWRQRARCASPRPRAASLAACPRAPAVHQSPRRTVRLSTIPAPLTTPLDLSPTPAEIYRYSSSDPPRKTRSRHDTRPLIMYENFVGTRSPDVALQENGAIHPCDARRPGPFFPRRRERVNFACDSIRAGSAAARSRLRGLIAAGYSH